MSSNDLKKRSATKTTKLDDNNNTTTASVDEDEAGYHKVVVYRRFGLNRLFGEVIMPLALFISIPTLSVTLWYIIAKCNGSLPAFYQLMLKQGSLYNIVNEVILSRFYLTKFSVTVVLGYFAWVIFLTLIIPGKDYYGSITVNGNKPLYKDNGFTFHIVNTTLFFIFAFYLETIGYSVATVYDRYDEILIALNIFGSLFCWFLYFKGIFFPSSTDCSTSGNILFDYYWGTELHPRIFGVDVKLITNCRFGMSVWFLAVVIFCWKCFKANGFTDSILVTTLLIGLYLTKFFYWESGYMKTIDIVLDRAGFYICYGCICWVPAFYTLPAMYLVTTPVRLGAALSITIFALGLLSLYVNYDADRQKQVVRATNGDCLIWGSKPQVIEANCKLLDGTKSTSLLLVSGYWGISRHFHYIPEIALSFFWSCTGLCTSPVAYFYVIFLTILLAHRSIRDDNKCSKKYGKYWDRYRAQVPYKIIPYVF